MDRPSCENGRETALSEGARQLGWGKVVLARLVHPRWALAILLAWIVLNYAWTLPFYPTLDDWIWFYGVSHLRERPQELFFQYFFSHSFFRPLIQLSFALNYALHGVAACGYRLLNVAAHFGVSALLWRLALALGLSAPTALASAMAFAVHPTRTGAVVWISGRNAVLCALFFTGAVLAEVYRRTHLGLLLFGAALLSKETAVCLPLVLLAGEALIRRKNERSYQRVLPYLLLLAVYAVVRWFSVSHYARHIWPVSDSLLDPAGFWQFVALLRAKVTVLGEFLFAPLPVHGFRRSLVLFVCAAAAAWWLPRPGATRTTARYGVLWAFSTMLPAMGWLSAGNWIVLEQWQVYLAVAGTCLATSAVAQDLLGRLRSSARRPLVAGVALTV